MSQWQLELKQAVTSYKELFRVINLDNYLFPQQLISSSGANFPLIVTHSYINRIQPQDPNDPLLLQILPGNTSSTTPKISSINYGLDPLEEKKSNILPGLIHKYHGRVLLLTTQSCAIHCQYCFRQHFPFSHNLANNTNLIEITKYITANPSIEEIILSGGDPLLANNRSIGKLFKILSEIDSIKTIRIHSRIPIVLPSRIDQELINILLNSRFNIVLVTHTNHPNELNQEVYRYIKQLVSTRIILLNQTVMLRKINDDPLVLAKLSKKLFEFNILPYYVHTLDPILGTENFAVDITKTKQIFQKLVNILPGYLVPKLVTELPGGTAKSLVNFSNKQDG